jgi:hypothetical protein
VNRRTFLNSALISLSSIACCVLLASASPPLSAAKSGQPTADAIIAKYVEAIGGLEALQKIDTRSVRYRVHTFGRDGYSMERSWKRPNIMRSGPPGAPSYTLTEGRKSWRVGPDGRHELPDQVAANFARLADIDGPLVDSAKKGISVEYVGTGQFDMVELHQIRLTFEDGTQWEQFFDARSGLLRKMKQPAFYMLNNEITQGPDTWTYYYDYRPVQDILFPHIWVQATDDHTHAFVTEEILINE